MNQEVKLEQERIIKGLLEGDKKLDLHKDQEIVIFLGNTGAGKSTIINHSLGHQLEKFDHYGSYVYGIQTQSHKLPIAKIGHSNQASETTLPEKFYCEELNLYFCDLPGFKDTRGPEQRVLNSIFTQRIIKNSKNTRILIVIDYNSIKASRGKEMKSTFKILHNLLINLTKSPNSVGFIITKVDTDYSDEQLSKQFERQLDEAIKISEKSLQNHKNTNQEDMQLKQITIFMLTLIVTNHPIYLRTYNYFERQQLLSFIKKSKPLGYEEFDFDTYDQARVSFHQQVYSLVPTYGSLLRNADNQRQNLAQSNEQIIAMNNANQALTGQTTQQIKQCLTDLQSQSKFCFDRLESQVKQKTNIDTELKRVNGDQFIYYRTQKGRYNINIEENFPFTVIPKRQDPLNLSNVGQEQANGKYQYKAKILLDYSIFINFWTAFSWVKHHAFRFADYMAFDVYVKSKDHPQNQMLITQFIKDLKDLEIEIEKSQQDIYKLNLQTEKYQEILERLEQNKPTDPSVLEGMIKQNIQEHNQLVEDQTKLKQKIEETENRILILEKEINNLNQLLNILEFDDKLTERFKRLLENYHKFKSLKSNKEQEEQKMCPISQVIMQNPVLTLCNHTFEKGELQRYFEKQGTEIIECPLCRNTVKRVDLVPATHLKEPVADN